MKQTDAAKVLGISASMLSKRWREAMHGKKWPYRMHRRMMDNKEIYSFNECGGAEPTIFAPVNDNNYVEI